MYIQCICGNNTFRITLDFIAECTKCGRKIAICDKNKRIPKPFPEPLPPKLPKYWFRI
ncbi:MAG: hypothetical protein J7K36_10860 [Archaeoglobaceae archaeon]|nr:hypothetical protein [Archaeoglobaceae archaeon]